MSPELGLIVFLGLVFVYALVSRRLASSMLTAPMIFLAGGLACAQAGLIEAQGASAGLEHLAEAALVALLFADAAMINPRTLLRDAANPARMLLIGLPLAIALGFVAGMVLLPGWPVWEIALLAAVLAPTDAALGQSIITNPAIPERMRRNLSAESGLNDGLALPFVVFFGCFAVGGIHDEIQYAWYVFVGQQLGFGLLAGAIVGGLGGWALRHARLNGLASRGVGGLAAVALAGLAYLVAQELGGNGFIAAFIAGLIFGGILKEECHIVLEFIETEGQLVSQLAFFSIGVLILPFAFAHTGPGIVLLILLSLFVLRPAAIWLSLPGMPARERLFYGWFGPRGLATALFALLVLDTYDGVTRHDEILAAAGLAVLLSAVLHGASAGAVGRAYAAAQPARG